MIETAAGEEYIAALRARGHSVKAVPRDAGTAHLIAREAESWSGAAEPRVATATVVAGSD